MSKHSALSSPVDDVSETKRIKLEFTHEVDTTLPEATSKQPQQDTEANHDEAAQSGQRSDQALEACCIEVEPKLKSKRRGVAHKAGEGFTPWKPKPAYVEIPKLQPHWGVIPRPGKYERPSEVQPPARTSDGAVRPPLWEDRKGAVRIKRGSRYIKGYDQAYHMWLPLMDVRPISTKNQTPRRVPVGYYYPHGMPTDWSSTGAINDLNKGLVEAIKAKSNKEVPFDQTERKILAQIFAEDPDISLLDAAELFNERAHPVTASEEGRYPTGRFTESIRHEFLMYKSCYGIGQAPDQQTEKDIPLDKLFAEWKEERTLEKAAARRGLSVKRPLTWNGDGDVMKKARGSKKVKITEEEMAAKADATYAKIVAEEEREEAEKNAAGELSETTAGDSVETTSSLQSDSGEAVSSLEAVASVADVVAVHSEINTVTKQKAMREIEIDENYDEEF